MMTVMLRRCRTLSKKLRTTLMIRTPTRKWKTRAMSKKKRMMKDRTRSKRKKAEKK